MLPEGAQGTTGVHWPCIGAPTQPILVVYDRLPPNLMNELGYGQEAPQADVPPSLPIKHLVLLDLRPNIGITCTTEYHGEFICQNRIKVRPQRSPTYLHARSAHGGGDKGATRLRRALQHCCGQDWDHGGGRGTYACP